MVVLARLLPVETMQRQGGAVYWLGQDEREIDLIISYKGLFGYS
jgi:hypothetical protein